jgi:hypothetical protein
MNAEKQKIIKKIEETKNESAINTARYYAKVMNNDDFKKLMERILEETK